MLVEKWVGYVGGGGGGDTVQSRQHDVWWR